MNLDIVINRGDDKKHAVVLVHGLGMDKRIWSDPPESRILGGIFSLSVLLKKYPSGHTIFHDLKRQDYPVITWSQERPAGPIDAVVDELGEIMRIASGLTEKGIILVCHSRGGLVARKYMMKPAIPVEALITISTPHKGSSVAKAGKYIYPIVSFLKPFIPEGEKGSAKNAIKKIMQFLTGRALTELLPGSDFFKALKDEALEGVRYCSIGGTSPTLFKLYNFSFPDVFEKVMPQGFYPEEMKKNKGDGLVSAESSRLPWAQEHYNFPCNHAAILFDKRARDRVAGIIKKIDMS